MTSCGHILQLTGLGERLLPPSAILQISQLGLAELILANLGVVRKIYSSRPTGGYYIIASSPLKLAIFYIESTAPRRPSYIPGVLQLGKSATNAHARQSRGSYLEVCTSSDMLRFYNLGVLIPVPPRQYLFLFYHEINTSKNTNR